MSQYKIEVTYTKIDNSGNVIEKVMPFLTSANSIEEARISVQQIAESFVNKVNGTIISII